ncbi:hypothetical protein ACJMK2_022558 [Sinanodonta woodiana]|uniref:Uncharacterized protein n=1 Tax=Sinanodonta woodiana TaxID=1069815 RepID=A0ABD3TLH2_SINWO
MLDLCEFLPNYCPENNSWINKLEQYTDFRSEKVLDSDSISGCRFLAIKRLTLHAKTVEPKNSFKMRTDIIFLCTVICVSVARAFPFVPDNAEVLRQNYNDISVLPVDSESSDSDDSKVLFLYPNSLKESQPTDQGLDRSMFSLTRNKRYPESMHSLVPRLMSNAVHAVRGKRLDGRFFMGKILEEVATQDTVGLYPLISLSTNVISFEYVCFGTTHNVSKYSS